MSWEWKNENNERIKKQDILGVRVLETIMCESVSVYRRTFPIHFMSLHLCTELGLKQSESVSR